MDDVLSQDEVDALLGSMDDYYSRSDGVNVKIEKAENGFIVTVDRKTSVFLTAEEVVEFMRESIFGWCEE